MKRVFIEIRESLETSDVFLYTSTGVLLCSCPSREIANVIGASLGHVLVINEEFLKFIEKK